MRVISRQWVTFVNYRKRRVVSILLAAGFVFPAAARAQQPAKIPRVGYLDAASTSAERIEAFRQGLRDLGYVDGKNIVVDRKSADGRVDRLAALAAELVRLKTSVIVTGGTTATRSAHEATATIPIVMAQDPDPVGNGFVASLARPGGNISGLSSLTAELAGKRLELLKEIIPNVSRVAVFGSSPNAGNARQLKETEIAARSFGITLQYLDIKDVGDIDTAFRGAARERAEAILVLSSPVTTSEQLHVAALAAKRQLPAIYSRREAVEDGGLLSYGVSIPDLERRAATYVDKILKGAKPADLPVEQPTKFELVINLKAAKQIGLTIPPNMLARADRVIK